jgi:hypothetical protein
MKVLTDDFQEWMNEHCNEHHDGSNSHIVISIGENLPVSIATSRWRGLVAVPLKVRRFRQAMETRPGRLLPTRGDPHAPCI